MLLETMISLMCATTPHTYTVACSNAATATAIQIEFKKNADKIEDVAKKKVTGVTGDTVWGVGGFGYKAVKDKQIKYKMNTHKSILNMDYISPQIDYKDGNKGGSITFGWVF